MDDKLFDLLRLVVEEYVATAEPVASATLVGRYGLGISPATIRNWFADLDAEKLLLQPHTSGGRVPTELGFKTYIAHFVKAKPASKREREALAKAAGATREYDRRAKRVAKTLAELSGYAVILALNESDSFYTGLSRLFAQPEFKNWERVVSLTELLDHLDETLGRLRRHLSLTKGEMQRGSPLILIGGDCPFGDACGSFVASSGNVIMALLGPIRMDYQTTLSQFVSALEILKD